MNDVARSARNELHDLHERVDDAIEGAIADVKPRLRGWLHAVNAPLTLAAGVVLVVLSPDTLTRVGSAVFALTALLLFTVSAVYHRGTWSRTTHDRLKRFDHANIFLLIAGSCTPFALLLLDGAERWTMLAISWGGAIAGVALKVLWHKGRAARWLSAPIYIALGWAPVFYFGDFFDGATRQYEGGVGIAVMVLVIVGGGLYTLGALVYGFKFPDPSPRWFGFHEVFHSFTILAFVTHYVGVSIATYSLR